MHHIIHAALDVAGTFTVIGILIGALLTHIAHRITRHRAKTT
jgi:hypothetical protein